MGKTYKTPSENLEIRQCLMEDGHGAVTLGSEMAGGVINLTVEECIFSRTDRGLRIKTRRGRGRDAVISNITFRNLTLDHVMTPLVVNSFYFCDPDGRTPYVQSREPYPVDDRTPSIRKMVFENMTCTNCHVAAAYFEGLPEQKIEELVMKNISFSYAENPTAGVPAMSEGVPKSTKRGLFARNVAKQLGIAFYGKEEIKDFAIKHSLVENYNDTEKLYNDFLSLEANGDSIIKQANVIKEIANAESCVIVGRSSDYILRDNKNLVKIFLYAPEQYKIETIKKLYNDDDSTARKYMQKSDKARSTYYEVISNQIWGNKNNYDICLDCQIGNEEIVKIICNYVKNKMKN